MAFAHLPTELLDMVLRHLSKSQLKVARQTCKLISNSFVPLLFDTVYVAANRFDMEKAALLCSSFGHFVHHMVYGSLIYDRLNLYDFVSHNYKYELDTGSEDEEGEGPVTGEMLYKRLTHTQRRNLQLFWTLHCSLINEQETFVTGGNFQSQLSQLFRASHKLCKVTIHDFSGACCYWYGTRVDGSSLQQNPLPLTTGLLHAVKLNGEHQCYERVSSLTSPRNNPMAQLLKAVVTTQISLSGISIDVSIDRNGFQIPYTSGLNLSGIFVPTQYLQQLSKPLSVLTELILHFKTPYASPQQITNLLGQPTILSTAINLRSLRFEILNREDQDHLPTYVRKLRLFDALMGSCSFPKLECLFLSNLDGTEAEVLHFLQRSPKLKHLALHWLWLTSGTWAHLLKKLQNSLMLETVEIENAEGEPGEVYFENLEPWSNSFYKDWASVVTRFFLNDGPNPFHKNTWQENRGDDKEEYRYCPVTSQ